MTAPFYRTRLAELLRERNYLGDMIVPSNSASHLKAALYDRASMAVSRGGRTRLTVG